MFGGPRLGIGGFTSLVSMGGPESAAGAGAGRGATVEVGRGPAIWYRGLTGTLGMVTTMDWGRGALEVRGLAGRLPGTSMGARVGGPGAAGTSPAMLVTISAVCSEGGLGLPELSRSVLGWVSGDPGILAIILGADTLLGPGGRPGPTLAPRGDIFCLDLGLGWLGRAGAGDG